MDKQKGWVKSYKNYLTDIDELFKAEMIKTEYSEIVFLGLSMGGAIGLRYAELNPGLFSKIIVNSPMIELKLGDKNERLVAGLMRLNIMGASTNQWLLEGIKLGRKTFRKRSKLGSTPILLFQAGIEHFSRYKRQSKLYQELSHCALTLVKESKHEILMERDSIRTPVMKKILNFLK
jgi:alpha-beta hydrolase superfamily lysophospholipase